LDLVFLRQAGLELSILLLSLPRAGIINVCNHTWHTVVLLYHDAFMASNEHKLVIFIRNKSNTYA
jgi:hypothetical protein